MYDAIVRNLQVFATPVIGIIVAIIAYQQWRTNNYRLKLDLYEKRYKVYTALKKLLSTILIKGNAENEAIDIFMSEIREVDFLFEEDIATYLIDDVYKKAIALQCNQKLLFGDNSSPTGPERSKLARENADLKQWFTNQFDVAKNNFKKYLDFQKII